MGRVILLLFCAGSLAAQSITITKPAAGDAVSGYSGYYFQVSLSSAPSVVRVCYTVDSYAAYNPGIDGPTTLGCSIAAPFSYPYNSFWNLNGPHQVIATAYDALNNAVATSAAVPFTVANAWPQSWNPAMTISTATSLSSPWSGGVNVTATYAGSGSGDSKIFYYFIDGIPQANSGTITAASATWKFDTTQFPDGPHVVCVTSTDATGAAHYSDGTVDASTEWCRTVTFSNTTALTNYVVTSAHDIYLAPGATYTLTGRAAEANGTASTATSVYYSTNTSVATVNASTGRITGVANGNTQVYAMAPTFNVSDLSNLSIPNTTYICSASFTLSMQGELINITGGAGVIPGIYILANMGTSSCGNTDRAWNNAAVTAGAGTFGPTRKDYVFVWPTNTTPCVGGDGTRYSTYNSACTPIHTTFSLGIRTLGSDQPYNPGAAADWSAGGIHTFEPAIVQYPISRMESPTGQAAYQTGEASYVSGVEALVSGFPKLDFYLIGDQIDRGDVSLWGATNGPAGQWTVPALTIGLQAWNNYRNIRGVAMYDEVGSSFGSYPLQGPITFGSSSQSWLNSIASNGAGTCTVGYTPWISGSGPPLNASYHFIIRGSSVANLNSTYPNVYTAAGATGTQFTFTCAGVPSGTYNAGNDPGLILEPYAVRWNSSSATGPAYGFLDSTAFAQLRKQYDAANVSFGFEAAPAGINGYIAMQNWQGNGTQSNSGVTQFGNIVDLYPPQSSTAYLISRIGLQSILASGDQGGWIRGGYGYFNPTLPMLSITQGVPSAQYGIGYGVQGLGSAAPALVSCSGNTLTFSTPVNLPNILPGASKIVVAGATDTGSPQDSCNNNFLILAHPTPTTFTVALAQTDFNTGGGSDSGGTIHWSDGTTTDVTGGSVSAAGTGSVIICGNNGAYVNGTLGTLCGDLIRLTNFPASISRHRGQTFNITGTTGTGSSNFASGTFIYDIENTDNGQPIPYIYYHEIPSLSATGGAGTVIADMNYIKGRNASMDIATSGEITSGDTSLDYAFASSIECLFLRCAGERIYNTDAYASGYSTLLGFTNPDASGSLRVFGDTALGSHGQLYMNQHFENDNTVPIYHAHNFAALIWNRLAKYWFQPRLNSPDYGPYLDCAAARGGTVGAVMGCMNVTDGPETQAFSLSAYETPGQNIVRYVTNKDSIGPAAIITAGTATDTITLQPGDVVIYTFPAAFSTELQQPSLSAKLSDIPTAMSIVVQWAYDPYYLMAAPNAYSCGTGACTPPWDRNIGTIYYRVLYLGSNSQVLATSDIQKL